MDYDITESMMASWLRYIKECQIVETNWHYVIKNEVEDSFDDFIDQLLKKEHENIVYYSKNENNNHVYKLTPSNLFKQIEIDCLGISLTNNTIYAVETAFHSNGLGYKDNKKKLISKALRTIITMYYLKMNIDNKDLKIKYIFTTPVLKSKNILNEIKDDIDEILNTFNKGEKIYDIEFICGKEEFKKQVMDELLNCEEYENNNDNSEVFLRACKLLDSIDYIKRDSN